jgi:extradiol dioxygenase family protein
MRPIFHLSFPVRDLDEALAFYTSRLGARIGRRSDTAADVLVFGAQVTVHEDPSAVAATTTRTRHFGATLSWDEWEAFAARLAADRDIVEGPRVSFEGETIEQGKLMMSDPSGNLIEIKAYRNPAAVLGALAG